jgi:hypothetical protein
VCQNHFVFLQELDLICSFICSFCCF